MAKRKQIEKYIDSLKSKNEAFSFALKEEMLPKTFFKYRVLNENTLNCLERNSIWLSSANKQNDPFDSAINFSEKELLSKTYTTNDFIFYFKNNYGKDISEKDIKRLKESSNPEKTFQNICAEKGVNILDYFSKELRQLNIESDLNDLKTGTVISCFSERNDSILMWSHYTNNHKGICIEYDFNSQKEILNFIEPIYYSNNIISLSKSFINKNYFNISKIAAITKAKDWQYEKEWRIVFQNKKNGYFGVPLPKNIFLGAKFFDNDLNDAFYERLVKYSNSNQIPLKRMYTHKTKYKIVEIKNA